MHLPKATSTAAFKFIFISFLSVLIAFYFASCASFSYKTYKPSETEEDPEPNYEITLNPQFQDFTTFMFIGNRMENFGTYFNTFYNAKENFDYAFDDYNKTLLLKYSQRIDSIYESIPLGQETIDNFNKAIEKASKVIQYHKSSAFMDEAVLLIGKSYFYLGDYLKAERKFGEFISKLQGSKLYDEASLFQAKTQIRLHNYTAGLDKLQSLTKVSNDKDIVAEAYRSIAEYYISQKDFPTAIDNYKKSIEYSSDKEFKAQMQFLIASVVSRTDPGKAAFEFSKVLDYSTSYDLEYFSRYNSEKNRLLSKSFSGAQDKIMQLQVDYKDNTTYIAEIKLLSGLYYEQKKQYPKAVDEYTDLIKSYPKTIPSSDASFAIGKYYESKGDYLTALKYYKYSMDESIEGHNTSTAIKKTATFTKYFNLQSIITQQNISTDYDSLFLIKVKNEDLLKSIENEGDLKSGKPGGYPFQDSIKRKTPKKDSLITKDTLAIKDTLTAKDTAAVSVETIAKAKFELAELFVYDLNRLDSAEYYLNSALSQSEDNVFKSKVMFALAGIYRNTGNSSKADEVLGNIVKEYPATDAAAEARKLLGMKINGTSYIDEADSMFVTANDLLNNKQYRDALETYKLIPEKYPASPKITKAYYSAGWIYENAIYNNDSAYIYYSKVLEAEPNSEFSKTISGKVLEYITYNESLKDSLKTNQVNDSLKNLPKNDSLKTPTDSSQNLKKELNPGEQKNDDGSEVINPDKTNEQPPVQKDIKKEIDPTGEEKK